MSLLRETDPHVVDAKPPDGSGLEEYLDDPAPVSDATPADLEQTGPVRPWLDGSYRKPSREEEYL